MGIGKSDPGADPERSDKPYDKSTLTHIVMQNV
jgi:hypothetical protein